MVTIEEKAPEAGLDNAIRIKSDGSRGRFAHNIVYVDISVRNSPNPITLDTDPAAAGHSTASPTKAHPHPAQDKFVYFPTQ